MVIDDELDGVGSVRLPDGRVAVDVEYQICRYRHTAQPNALRRTTLRLRAPVSEAMDWLLNHPNGLLLTINDGRTIRFGVTDVDDGGWVEAAPAGGLE